MAGKRMELRKNWPAGLCVDSNGYFSWEIPAKLRASIGIEKRVRRGLGVIPLEDAIEQVKEVVKEIFGEVRRPTLLQSMTEKKFVRRKIVGVAGGDGTRKKMSTRDRFMVFNRDSFQCQYCGRRAPDVFLEVDHIIPISKMGLDSIENMITSCSSCNHGKSNLEIGGHARAIHPTSSAQNSTSSDSTA
jgi:5-methylcytosine-specific restriction endonuclease McrA